MKPTFNEVVQAMLAVGVVGAIIGMAALGHEAEAVTAVVAGSGTAIGYYLGRQSAHQSDNTPPTNQGQ